MDDFSKKTWLFFLAKESQIFEVLEQFQALVETIGRRIEGLRSDKGGEYLSNVYQHISKLMMFINHELHDTTLTKMA